MPSACSSGGGGVTLQTVCRVRPSIPAAIWARPTAHHRPPRVADTHASSTARRNSLHRSHGLAKALRSGIRLVESFLTGLSFPAELPAIDCRPTADMASRPRSSARLPCADGVARGRSASEAKARSARPQKLKSELYQGVEANGEGVGGSNPLAQTK